MLYGIETKCLTAADFSLFEGTEAELRTFLDGLSAEGWDVAQAFTLGESQHA